MVYILLGTGFEEIEAITPCDLLRRAGIETRFVGLNGETIVGSHGIAVKADLTVDQLDLSDAELVMLPGGLQGVASIRASKEALNAVQQAWDSGLYVAAICAGPTVLADLHITDHKSATCFPGQVQNMGCADLVDNAAAVADGKLITGTSAGCAVPFGLKLIETLRGIDAAHQIAEQIVIR